MHVCVDVFAFTCRLPRLLVPLGSMARAFICSLDCPWHAHVPFRQECQTGDDGVFSQQRWQAQSSQVASSKRFYERMSQIEAIGVGQVKENGLVQDFGGSSCDLEHHYPSKSYALRFVSPSEASGGAGAECSRA